jgi:cytidylate kinase
MSSDLPPVIAIDGPSAPGAGTPPPELAGRGRLLAKQ